MCHHQTMKSKIVYKFDPQKNALLIANRGVSFEEVIAILYSTGPLDILMNPNAEKYAHQKMYVIEMHDYIYLYQMNYEFRFSNGHLFVQSRFSQLTIGVAIPRLQNLD